MKFKNIYYMDEKFTGTFSKRDFGDATPKMVDMPNDIDYDRIETYAHNKDLVFTYIFKDGEITHFTPSGTFDNVLNGLKEVSAKDLPGILLSYPGNPKSFAEYSGVEPIKPPINNYSGIYNIPKEFNMTKFNPYGSFKGIRDDEDWDLN